MSLKVAIVGIGQTKYEANKSDMWQGDVAYDAIEKALQQTGLTYQDVAEDGFGIEKILTTGEDHFIGRTCNFFWIHHYIGAFGLAQNNVSGDGTYAVYHAVLEILSGHHDIIMVVSNTKESETSRGGIENCIFDHIFLQPLGFDYLTAASLQAQRYMYKYGIQPEQCAKAAVKSRRNAKRNPYAQEPLSIDIDDVLGSRMLASPIRVLDSKPPVSDGACAIILASEKAAKKITDKPVWVRGIGNCYDAHYLGDRDLADCDSLALAAQRAYRMAGISDPLKEIDVAEISTEYSYQELLWTEGLGFCGRGEGGHLIDSGATQMKGELPINPSGGILAGNPFQVAGTARVAEAALQLRGEAGRRQIKNAKTALAHGFYGPCGQSQCVIILGN
ncbi:MAG TPA: thiolase family protein [Dehalococcoidia bacterium]|nr:thiolase family protein [Dehalococcoidia bacterium]